MTLRNHRYTDRGPTSSKDYNERTRETLDSFLSLAGRTATAEAELEALTLAATAELMYGAQRLSAIETTYAGLTETVSKQALLGTVTEATASTVTTSGLTVNRYAGGQLTVMKNDGTNKQTKTIVSNTATVFTVSGQFNPIPDNTYVYMAERNVGRSPRIIDLFSITNTGTAALDADAGLAVLPYSARVSKLHFDAGGTLTVDPAVTTAYTYSGDMARTTVSSLERALDGSDNTAFLVAEKAVTFNGRTLTIEVSVPADAAAGALVNYIDIDPLPSGAHELTLVQYTTDAGYVAGGSPTWHDVYHYEPECIADERYVAPQEDGSHTQPYTGRRRYYFGERRVTGVKVTLTAASDITIDGDRTYVMGLRSLDVGHVTFAPTGTLTFETTFPTALKQITAVRAHVANRGTSGDGIDGIGVDDPVVTIEIPNDGNWVAYEVGDTVASGAEFTKARISVAMESAPNGCSPVVTAVEVEYTAA